MRIELDFRAKPITVGNRRPRAESKSARGLQCIDNVEVMREGFGEIFPWMRGCIGAYKFLLPSWGCATRIVTLKSILVILTFVAEYGSQISLYIHYEVCDSMTRVGR